MMREMKIEMKNLNENFITFISVRQMEKNMDRFGGNILKLL